ncbi:MAG: sugar kinase [Caulobacterales bacterium]
MTGPVVCFGELLIRLTAGAGERLIQTPALEAFVGGAEANVAVALANLGTPAKMVSTIPDNDLGKAALRHLRMHGVQTCAVTIRPQGRMGLYFLTPGAGIDAAEVLYDRAGSSFAVEPLPQSPAVVLEQAGWLHLSGITPAVSPAAADAALALVRQARALKVGVSFDGNYRAGLWTAWGGDGPATLRGVLAEVDIAFINARDIGLVLGFKGRVSESEALDAAFSAFPALQVMAWTTREAVAQDAHKLGAAMQVRGAAVEAIPPLLVTGIVDRIGAGDAFAAGFLHRHLQQAPLLERLRFGLFCGAAKHGQRGDAAWRSEPEIEALMRATSLDVRR